ncbi:DNA mismatch repair protein MutS [Cohaesibacter celericrescens]|uniref:DNA mismatch repair protein MutS n=2 Tax=Cohaesibacter celericrescens TaxID=2067669 RepID=A0A2N5XPS9_9HYPH|nr:DNA mismatch repair protein MutS [Cohaesibacter celericrescens]
MEGKSAELKALIEGFDQPKKTNPDNQPDPQHPVQRRRASGAELEALRQAGIAGNDRPKSGKAPPLNSLDRKEKKRIVQGRGFIDARLDLHGMTQREAHGALFGFLRSCHTNGCKHVLVITGKGSRGETETYTIGPEKGILRRVVPKWLSEPEIRSIIVGFEEAHPTLGGGGALHIRLRSRNKLK